MIRRQISVTFGAYNGPVNKKTAVRIGSAGERRTMMKDFENDMTIQNQDDLDENGAAGERGEDPGED